MMLVVCFFCKVNNLNFQISLNKIEKIIFVIKQNGLVRFSSIHA